METLISKIVGGLAGLAIFVSIPVLLNGAVGTETLIEEFLQLSMLKEEARIYNIFQGNQDQPAESGKKVDTEAREAVGTLQDVFRSENILSYMKGYLRRELLNGSTPELMAWLQSSLTQKMVELGHRDINPVEFDSYSKSLKVSPPAAERVALLKRLDIAAGMSESVLRQSMNVGQLLGGGMVEPMNLEQVNRFKEWGKTSLFPGIGQNVFQQNLFIYRTISDEELIRHVEFLESPLGTWYCKVLTGAREFAAAKARQQLHEANMKMRPQSPGQVNTPTLTLASESEAEVLLQQQQLLERRHEAEKARSLNFQRLLAQEERRAGGLDAELKRIKKDYSDIEARSRELSAELQTLREHCR